MFIEHRFLRQGFWSSLSHHELLLYLFLVLVSDRNGLSYYCYDKICSLLQITVDEYILARDLLIEKDLIAFNGSLFQVLALPQKPRSSSPGALKTAKDMQTHDPPPFRPMSSNTVGYHITKAMRKVGLSSTAYWLRHTYAQNLLESGASIFEIKEMLGHDKIESTKLYLHVHLKLMRKGLFDETF